MATQAESPMTKGQLIYTLCGLAVMAALFSIGFYEWGAYDPHIGEAFAIWIAVPVVNLLTVAMACLQIYFYTHPDPQEEVSEPEAYYCGHCRCMMPITHFPH